MLFQINKVIAINKTVSSYASILNAFGLPPNLKIHYIAGGGNVKSNPIPWFEWHGQRFLIKSWKTKSGQDAAYCVSYMQLAAQALLPLGIRVPFITRSLPEATILDQTTFETNHTRYSLETWATGIDLSPMNATEKLFEQLGKVLAILHYQSQGFSTYLRNDLELIQRWIELGSVDSDGLSRLAKILIGPVISRISSERLNHAVTAHLVGDLNLANCKGMDADHISAIFDWDQSRFGFRLEDFISPILHTGRTNPKRNLNPHQILKGLLGVLSGYQKTCKKLGYSKLSESEMELLPDIFLSYFARLHLKYAENTSLAAIEVLTSIFENRAWQLLKGKILSQK